MPRLSAMGLGQTDCESVHEVTEVPEAGIRVPCVRSNFASFGAVFDVFWSEVADQRSQKRGGVNIAAWLADLGT